MGICIDLSRAIERADLALVEDFFEKLDMFAWKDGTPLHHAVECLAKEMRSRKDQPAMNMIDSCKPWIDVVMYLAENTVITRTDYHGQRPVDLLFTYDEVKQSLMEQDSIIMLLDALINEKIIKKSNDWICLTTALHRGSWKFAKLLLQKDADEIIDHGHFSSIKQGNPSS